MSGVAGVLLGETSHDGCTEVNAEAQQGAGTVSPAATTFCHLADNNISYLIISVIALGS